MPTFSHGSTAAVYIGDSASTERNISNAVTNVDQTKTSDTAEVSALSNVAKAYVAGLADAQFSLSGSWDVTVDGYLYGVVGLARAFAICPAGSASTNIKYSGTAICTSYKPSSDVGDANKWTADFQCSGTITRTVL